MLPAQKRGLLNKPSWVQNAMQGYTFMREGTDYENNDKRYDKAHVFLKRAYTEAMHFAVTEHMDLAKICLWTGITLNENLDIDPFTKRNDMAIVWYKRGLKHLQRLKTCDTQCALVKASLYNSMGVAHHHRTTRWTTGGPIPQAAFYNYRKARNIILEHGHHATTKKEFEAIAKKLSYNTGGHVVVFEKKVIGGSNDSIIYGGNYV